MPSFATSRFALPADVRVLAIAYETYQVETLAELAGALAPGVASVLLSPYHLPSTDELTERCRRDGIPFVHETTALGGDADVLVQIEAATPPVTPRHRSTRPASGPLWARALRSASYRTAGRRLPGVIEAAERISVRAQQIDSILDVAAPDALLFAEHNVERDSGIWSAQAGCRGIPSVVVSSSSATPTEAAVTYAGSAEHRAEGLNRWLALGRPRWALSHAGRRHLRLPAAEVIAREAAGVAPTKPWVLNSGADLVCVESEAMRERNVELGLDAQMLRVTGGVMLDRIAAGFAGRTDARAALGIERDHAVVAVAMPPDQYPAHTAPGFSSYSDLLDAWLSTFAASRSLRFLLSLHPTQRGAARLEGLPPNVSVTDQGAAAVIPIADAYVASASSTIKWALACGLPVIDYDAYAYGYDEYTGEPAVTTVQTLEEFRDAVACLPKTPRASVPQPRWGDLDGGGVRRIEAVLADAVCDR